jgi:hypothetical protein
MTGMTSRTATAYPVEAPGLIRNIVWGTCCSIFSFLCSILQFIVCLFVPLRFAASGVFKRFLRGYHTLQGDNSLKLVERFDHMMFVCRFQASR